MTFRQGIAYVLRHAWLWPLEFWLRPLDVMDRLHKSEQGETVEVTHVLLRGAVWGALAGILVWLWTDEIQAIWILAIAVAGAVAVAVAGAGAGAGAGAAVADADAFAFAGIGTFVGIGAFVSVVAFAGVAAIAIAGIVPILIPRKGVVAFASVGAYLSILAFVGIILGIWLPDSIRFLSIAMGCILLFIYLGNRKNENLYIGTILFIIFPIIAFASFPQIKLTQTSIWGFSLVGSLLIGVLTGFVGGANGLWTATNLLNLRFITHHQSNWLTTVWALFLLLASAVWFPSFNTAGLNTKLDVLAIFFVITPFIVTGLIFWPILSLIAAWQFRSIRAPLYTPEYFISMIPFRWQTFAYPLPGLRKYLTVLCSQHGPDTALRAIQTVQFRSLQMLAAYRSALDLASHSDTALPFCGQVAITMNTATLIPLSLAGPVARAVIVLAAVQYNEDKQPLRLYVAKFPPKFSRIPFLYNTQALRWIEQFQYIRQQGLQARLAYALSEIKLYQQGTQLTEFRTLLEALLDHIHINSAQNIQLLSQLLERENHTNSVWLNEGWQILNTIKNTLSELKLYRSLDTPNARREFLERLIEKLQALSWDDFSEYWSNIGKELIGHWVNLLAEEAKQAREWLRLDMQPIHETLTTGQQTLQLQIHNPTTTLARNIRIHLDETPGLEWHHAEVKRNILEGGKNALMNLELETHEQGSFRISGRLDAEDLADNSLSLPFAFQLRIAQASQRYRLPDYQPYVIGEGVPDDRTFVGRQELLHWLRSLWLQPGGKAAVALVGQRRIGKTSLLNKIKRDGLPDTQLLPILVNIQGVIGDYDFLNSSAREMAAHLTLPQPVLDRANPYPDFKDFLLGLKPQLTPQRFLLMLDEADLIPQRQLGDLLPGFLRALMQEPEYPTLLLFCGTHALKWMSLEYSSILFNTAQFRTVSYMTAAESAEVLEKPARDILEFDPAALDDAYRLTRGQPLLLQSLGATLINHFNAIVLNGGERSNYVTPRDLDKAAAELAQQDNAAFEQHWQDSDAATHRLLAALAWATDETDRLQLDLPGIEARMAETRLTLPPKDTFKIVERLADEEILLREGRTYRFAVSLYRRWIAWRWPPERVREEPLDRD